MTLFLSAGHSKLIRRPLSGPGANLLRVRWEVVRKQEPSVAFSCGGWPKAAVRSPSVKWVPDAAPCATSPHRNSIRVPKQTSQTGSSVSSPFLPFTANISQSNQPVGMLNLFKAACF
uniref:Uncharacterized protein n=1 Tax=Sphaerodactylus townsendi TaxID=933632 RepID=A0ACB8ECZ6_9SAUR